MPTYESAPEFWRHYRRLTLEQRTRFLAAVSRFVRDLQAGRRRLGRRGRSIRSKEGVYEVTWAGDGRAFFRYGEPKRPGDVHIIWLRCGTHDIFDQP